jgi:hypothetical protein
LRLPTNKKRLDEVFLTNAAVISKGQIIDFEIKHISAEDGVYQLSVKFPTGGMGSGFRPVGNLTE